MCRCFLSSSRPPVALCPSYSLQLPGFCFSLTAFAKFAILFFSFSVKLKRSTNHKCNHTSTITTAMGHSMGFDWGFKPTPSATNQTLTTSSKISKPRLKRRLTNDDAAQTASTVKHRAYHTRRKAVASAIQGQPLPLPRAIELMDKHSLQTTLLQLVKIHPEIQHTLVSIQSLTTNIDQYVALLKQKLQSIYDNIPYSKYDSQDLNDYSFVRIKPYILEFLNCLVDCLLNSIPPQCQNLSQSLKFLDFATELLSQVPQFCTASNNYYKNICYEQLSEIWITVIKEVSMDINFVSSRDNLLHWFNRLQEHNGKCDGKLDKPVRFLNTVMDDNDVHTATSTPQQTAIWNNVV